MVLQNADIADQLDEIADLLEIQGANPFRIRAYRTGAQNLRDHPESAASMVANNQDLHQIPGIGDELAAKIKEAVTTGKMHTLERLKKEVPESLTTLLTIPGLGPKRVQTLYDKHHIRTLAQLKRAIKSHKIQTMPGFGQKSEAAIAEGIRNLESIQKRHLRADIADLADGFATYIKSVPGVTHVEICGSYRRAAETVGDLDFVVTSRQSTRAMNGILNYAAISLILAHGSTKSSVMLKKKIQADIRVVPQLSYGAALHYFTGSRAHVVALRDMAITKGLKINEYGVYKGGKRIAGQTETSVYNALGMDYIPPELRENHGEIQAAKTHTLPHRLVELADLQGDLHTHTNSTDGKNTLLEMALAAKAAGLHYMANTEHSERLAIAHGFTPRQVRHRINDIHKMNQELKGITILSGIEVDILEDGSLDLPDDVLGELDIVVASIHSHFTLSSDKQTKRLLKALDHPHITMLGHLSGRIIGRRPPMAFDTEKVLQAVKARGCFLELNSQPARLDITDSVARMAKDRGILVSIDSDSHSINGFSLLQYGVGQARRGWLEKENVLNSRPLSEFRKLIQAVRK